MAKIYLINVGANTGHSRKARSPVFPDGTWMYVPFPKNGGKGQPFPHSARPFVRVLPGTKSHLDPDWKGLTYGDCCKNPRARALLSVDRGDILLFWALLWKTSRGACIFESHDNGWFLIGALRVQYPLTNEDNLDALPKVVRQRARRNAHVRSGQVEGRHDVVFVGSRQHSCQFTKAVDLQVYRNGGLMHRVVKTKEGKRIRWKTPPRWNSVTRSCRAILDLDFRSDRKLARLLARRIKKGNKAFDLLEGA